MNESEARHEYEPEERRAVERYYHDIYDPELSESSVVIALDNLTKGLSFDPVTSVDELCKSCLYPTDYDLEQEPRIAKEKLAMLPIAHFGPKLDRSAVPLDELKQWYLDAARGVHLIVKGVHEQDCLDIARADDLVCAKSSICPAVFLQRYLMDGVTPPDFSRLSYLEDSKRAYAVALKKVSVAVKQRLVEPVYSQGALAAYTVEYFEQFGSDDLWDELLS